VIDVSVVPGSWQMNRVTTITTSQGQMNQTTHNYQTTVTRGESTSIADTVNWNKWSEVSEAVSQPLGRYIPVQATGTYAGTMAPDFNWGSINWGAAEIVGGAAAFGVVSLTTV